MKSGKTECAPWVCRHSGEGILLLRGWEVKPYLAGLLRDISSLQWNLILDYSMYWIMSIENYYKISGDEEFVRMIWPKMVTMMEFLDSPSWMSTDLLSDVRVTGSLLTGQRWTRKVRSVQSRCFLQCAIARWQLCRSWYWVQISLSRKKSRKPRQTVSLIMHRKKKTERTDWKILLGRGKEGVYWQLFIRKTPRDTPCKFICDSVWHSGWGALWSALRICHRKRCHYADYNTIFTVVIER